MSRVRWIFYLILLISTQICLFSLYIGTNRTRFRHASQPRDLNKHGIVVEDRVFFGGVTREDILKEGSKDIGIHHWAKEGIAGKNIFSSISVSYLFILPRDRMFNSSFRRFQITHE